MLLKCRGCGVVSDKVGSVYSMTAYPWDGRGEDPNYAGFMCPECEEGYCAHWQDMWDEYHAAIGG